MPKFILYISEADFSSLETDAECFLLETSLPPEFLKKFTMSAAQKNKIVLFTGENAGEISARLKADGVVFDLSAAENPVKAFKQCRRSCAKDAVVGVITRSRRHEAMLLSECEPDFLIFKIWKDGEEKTKLLVDWYTRLFLIQSAVFCRDENACWQDCETDIVILPPASYKIFVAKNEKLD